MYGPAEDASPVSCADDFVAGLRCGRNEHSGGGRRRRSLTPLSGVAEESMALAADANRAAGERFMSCPFRAKSACSLRSRNNAVASGSVQAGDGGATARRCRRAADIKRSALACRAAVFLIQATNPSVADRWDNDVLQVFSCSLALRCGSDRYAAALFYSPSMVDGPTGGGAGWPEAQGRLVPSAAVVRPYSGPKGDAGAVLDAFISRPPRKRPVINTAKCGRYSLGGAAFTRKIRIPEVAVRIGLDPMKYRINTSVLGKSPGDFAV